MPAGSRASAVIGALSAILVLPVFSAAAASYQDAVKNLSPSFYYELNETATAGGALDSMGHASPGIYEGDYTNGPPVVGGTGPASLYVSIPARGLGGTANLAHYSNDAGQVTLGPGVNYGANSMTVAFLMKAGAATGGDRIFTNNLIDPAKSLQVIASGNGLVIVTDPSASGTDAGRALNLEDGSGRDLRLVDPSSGWFHVVATTSGATGAERAASLKLWVNGVNRTAHLVADPVVWATDTTLARIGGMGADPAGAATHSGAQDEVAIWLNRTLTDPEVATLWAAARRAGSMGLNGWWPFDGDLNDRAGKGLQTTAMGSPAFESDTPAGSGQAVRFHPVVAPTPGEGVRVADAAPINIDDFTLGYFINLKNVAPGTTGLERLTGRLNYTFETAIGDANVIPGGTTSPTGITLSYYQGIWVVTNVPIQVDGWMHIAWRNTAAQMELFLNGVSVFTGPPVPPGRARGYMNFGTAQTNAESFSGLMDDAFIWDGSLTGDDIAVIAALGVGGYTGVLTDSDNDSLPDWWEIQNGLNAGDDGSVLAANGTAGNPDNDGLTNAQEFQRGTKPNDDDTDDDGLKDGDEITRNTNPLLQDTDGDGLNDGAEIARGTNPLDTDSDDDTVSDGDEVAAGSNPLDPLSGPPPSTFLVLHLMLDGNATDSSPQHNNGTVLSNATFVDDAAIPGGKALSVPNSGTAANNGSGINIPGNSTLSSNQFTLTYWVKPTVAQEGVVERLTSRAGDAFETAIGSGVGGGPEPLALSYYFGAWRNTGKGAPINQWTHVAWRNKGIGTQDFSLFVNGILVHTGGGMPTGRPGTGLMRIGTRHNGSEGFHGLMDDVRLYRAPLKDSDIFTISQATPQAPLDFTGFVRAANGSSATLTIQSRPGRTYAVDFSTGLNAAGQPDGWVELTDSLPSSGAQTVYIDTVASNFLRAFYRVRDVSP